MVLFHDDCGNASYSLCAKAWASASPMLELISTVYFIEETCLENSSSCCWLITGNWEDASFKSSSSLAFIVARSPLAKVAFSNFIILSPCSLPIPHSILNVLLLPVVAGLQDPVVTAFPVEV